jgi:type II secretory pathway component PulM
MSDLRDEFTTVTEVPAGRFRTSLADVWRKRVYREGRIVMRGRLALLVAAVVAVLAAPVASAKT